MKTLNEHLETDLPSSPLYHYTSIDGFYSICQRNTFRATHIKYLNDSTEYIHALDLIEKRAKEKSINFTPPSEYLVYVVSFSERKNSLPQWRAYCPDGGVAMGFSVAGFKAVAKELKFELIKCIYDKQSKEIIIDEFLDIWKASRNHSELAVALSQMCCIFKDESFSEENEWRFVRGSVIWETDNDEMQSYDRNLNDHQKFYTRDNMLIPYVDLITNKKFTAVDAERDNLIQDIHEIRFNSSLTEREQAEQYNVAYNTAITSILRSDVVRIFKIMGLQNNIPFNSSGDGTNSHSLPLFLVKLIIGPGNYNEQLFKESIRSYVLQSINKDADSMFTEYDRARWSDDKSIIESKIPYRSVL